MVKVCDKYEFKVEGQDITVCHYAMRVWNKSHFGAWQIYAHSHGELPPIGLQYDCGVDCNDFCPVSFEELKIIMSNKKQHHIITKDGEKVG